MKYPPLLALFVLFAVNWNAHAQTAETNRITVSATPEPSPNDQITDVTSSVKAKSPISK